MQPGRGARRRRRPGAAQRRLRGRPRVHRGDLRTGRPRRGSGDGCRSDARLGRRRRDRQRGDGARPDAAGLRLPERRAGLATRRGRRGPDRAVGCGRGVRPRRVPLRRRIRRAPVRILGGRRPGAQAAPGGPSLRAGAGRARSPRAFRQPGLGLGAKELPDGLRPRLRAAQVARAHRRPVGGGAGARRNPLRRPGDRRSQRRRAARPRRRVSGRCPDRALPGRAGARAAGEPRREPPAAHQAADPASFPARERPCAAEPRAGRLSPRRHQRPLPLTRGRARLARRRSRPRRRDPGVRQPGGGARAGRRRHAGRLRGADGPVSRPRRGDRGPAPPLARASRLPRADPRPAARPRDRRHLDAAGGHDRGRASSASRP